MDAVITIQEIKYEHVPVVLEKSVVADFVSKLRSVRINRSTLSTEDNANQFRNFRTVIAM